MNVQCAVSEQAEVKTKQPMLFVSETHATPNLRDMQLAATESPCLSAASSAASRNSTVAKAHVVSTLITLPMALLPTRILKRPVLYTAATD